MNTSILKEIIKKREFSQLPKKDIEKAFTHFEKRQISEEEKIDLTKELLRKIFSVFTSKKLLSLKNKDEEWILRKHISTRERMNVHRSSNLGQTRERLPYYEEIYKRIFKNLIKEKKEISVIDLGAGINGFSYKKMIESISSPPPSPYHPPINTINYLAIESLGQLVELMNYYFKKENLQKNAKAIHLSLFELEKVKKIIKRTKKPRVVLLLKVLDALEMLEKNYSKKLINEIVSLSDRVVLSFATRSLGSRERFKINREWILSFIRKNYVVLEDFEIAGERYVVFEEE